MSLLDEQIDDLADQFEQNWNEQSILTLKNTINTLPKEIQQKALSELLLMEFELRFKNGLPVNLKFYKKLLSQYPTEIETTYNNLLESRKLGGYEFYECIGQGGMGTVYRARHRLLDKIVAIKLLKNDLLEHAGGLERITREIKLCGKLNHPNIIKSEYADKENDCYYLVMEFINGEDLRKIIQRHRTLALPTACEIIRQAASGLQYASEHNIIHRDIKPGNLMISHEGIVKILDFGLGKFIAVNQPEHDYALTTIGSTMGSVDYIAPEQWKDAASAKIQADIYSLGCLFFFLLTGHAPFDNPQLNRDQRMIEHLQGTIPALSSFCNNVPQKIENCYKKMLAKNPKDRFEEPAEIAAILEPFAEKNSLQFLPSPTIFATTDQENTTTIVKILPTRRLFKTTFIRKYLPRTLLMILVGYGIYFAGTMKSNRNNDNKKIPNANTLNVAQLNDNSISTSPLASPILASISLTENLAETLQFIGYSGRWWFEDIPWYLPFVRETTAHAVNEKNLLLQNKNITPEFIASFIPKQQHTKQLLDFLVTTGSPKIENAAEFESLVNNYLAETNTINPPASVLHTQAVLLHQLTIQNNNPELGQHARELYLKAIEHYENEKTTVSHLLGNLCRFDAAQLNWWFDGNAENFYKQINNIKITNEDDTVFRAELLAVSAERFMEEGQNRDDFFNDAIKLVEKYNHNKEPNYNNESNNNEKFNDNLNSNSNSNSVKNVPHHPMLEKLHQRFAIALTRQWRLANAEMHWNKVLELATNTAIAAGNDHQSARLCDAASQARLTLATTARYCGNLNSARFRCRDLIGNIQDVLTYLDPSEEEEKLRLNQKLAQAMEYLADCTLFTPTHFGKQPIPNSRFFVTEAESWYRQANEITNNPHSKFILQCKSALLRLNLGNLNKEEQKIIHHEIQLHYNQLATNQTINQTINQTNNQPTYQRATEYYHALDALLGNNKTDPDSEINRIKNWLDNNRLNRNPVARYAGERLDLQLFCIRLLLKTEQQQNNNLLQQDLERYLDPILLQHLAAESKMRPFLLPFYDFAIHCRKNDDLLQTVLTIRTARCQRYSGLLPKSLLVFYFPLNSENGFAVFLLPDQQECKRFNLGFNRQQVIEAAENHQTLLLPEELVANVKQMWAESIPVDISWDDSVCWNYTHLKKRLSNEQWVFNSQLPADLIWGIIR
jgi:serine/threonine protein kinase